MTPSTSSSTIFPSIWFLAESFVANGIPSLPLIWLEHAWVLGQSSDFSARLSNQLKLTVNQLYPCESQIYESYFRAHSESSGVRNMVRATIFSFRSYQSI